jgi:hypothetical protein
MDRRYIFYIVVVASTDIAAAAAGPLILEFFGSYVGFAVAYGVAAVVTFLGLLPIAIDRSIVTAFGFRELMASVILIIFFLLLTSQTSLVGKETESSLTPQLVSNFTAITITVVGAYFGASAIERISASRNGKTKETNEETNEAQDAGHDQAESLS